MLLGYESRFRINYKKGIASDEKYAVTMNDLKNICIDFGCPLMTEEAEYMMDMVKGETYTIQYPHGTTRLSITRL